MKPASNRVNKAELGLYRASSTKDAGTRLSSCPGDYPIIQFGHNDEKSLPTPRAIPLLPRFRGTPTLPGLHVRPLAKGAYSFILMNSIVSMQLPGAPGAPDRYRRRQI